MPKDYLLRDLTAAGTADYVGRALTATNTKDFIGRDVVADWVLSTVYAVGDYAVLSTGEVLQVTVAGTSDAVAEPAAPGYGETVADGTVTWVQVSN